MIESELSRSKSCSLLVDRLTRAGALKRLYERERKDGIKGEREAAVGIPPVGAFDTHGRLRMQVRVGGRGGEVTCADGADTWRTG